MKKARTLKDLEIDYNQTVEEIRRLSNETTLGAFLYQDYKDEYIVHLEKRCISLKVKLEN